MEWEEREKGIIKEAARKLTGPSKREFMGKVAEEYLGGSARKAERELGWNRKSVQLGINERRTGLRCVDNYRARGRHKSEEVLPNLERDIHELLEGKSQADPKFKTTFAYARISARAVRAALIEEKGYSEEQLPTRQTIGEIMNRLGYRLKKRRRPNP